MSKNRASNGEWQLFSDRDSEAYQLDLLSYVTDYSPITISRPEKKLRNNNSKLHSDKLVGFHYFGIVDKDKRFDTFEIGTSNQNSVIKIKKFISNEFNESNVLIIEGKSGLGKSHLLHAIANDLLKDKRTFYLSSAFLVSSSVDGISIFNNYSFVLIDDFQEIDNNKELQKVFCYLLDQAHLGKLKIVLTSSKDLNLLKSFEDRILQKIKSSMHVSIDFFDEVIALNYLNNKLIKLNFNIDELYSRKLVSKHQLNGYVIDGLLLKLKDGSLLDLNHDTSDICQGQTSLLDFEQEGIKLIIKNVALDFHITEDDIFSNKRDRYVVLARHVAMYILKEKVGLSLNQIGKIFFKDHTTVIYAIEKIKNKINNNVEFKNRILKLVF